MNPSLLMLIIFVVTLIFGLPIFFCIGAAMLGPILFCPGFSANAQFVVRSMVAGVDTSILLALPLFILSGNIMGVGGISGRLFDVFALLTGKRSGGIPIAVILTSVIYAAICGSGPAAAAAVGAMAIPVLRKLKYKDEFSCVISASGGGIGIIIPPSLPFVTYAVLTSSSVGDLFKAGVVPGLLIAAILIVFIVIYCKRNGEDHEAVIQNYKMLRARGVGRVLKDGIFALLAPVIILGGIYGGIVTPTEAAVISVFYSLIICVFVYKSIKLKELWKILVDSVAGVAGIGIMIALAMAMSKVLTTANVTALLTSFVMNTFASKAALLGVIIILLLIVGMFIDVMPVVILTTPILWPIMKQMGVNVTHFGIILCTLVSLGMITPPYGLNLFVTAGIAKIQVSKTFKVAILFSIAYLIAIILITYIPGISMWLINVSK